MLCDLSDWEDVFFRMHRTCRFWNPSSFSLSESFCCLPFPVSSFLSSASFSPPPTTTTPPPTCTHCWRSGKMWRAGWGGCLEWRGGSAKAQQHKSTLSSWCDHVASRDKSGYPLFTEQQSVPAGSVEGVRRVSMSVPPPLLFSPKQWNHMTYILARLIKSHAPLYRLSANFTGGRTRVTG
jgi:hypothetical protein